MKTNIKTKLNQAFSLIELLVVIAVIAVIAAIAIPNITGTREAAVAAQASAETASLVNMSNQLVALGYTGSITASALSNGITVTPEGTTNPITFKLSK